MKAAAEKKRKEGYAYSTLLESIVFNVPTTTAEDLA